MAGLPWFELDVDFHESPKVQALASRLREPLADAYVARLYAYCYRHARDRFAPDVASSTIEEACRWRGRRGFLFDALFAADVLERDGGKVVVHGVAERLAPHLAKRMTDAERQRRRRAKAAESIGRPAPVTPDVTRDDHRDDPCDVTRESRRDTDKDTDKDTDTSVDSQPIRSTGAVRLAGPLDAVREDLAKALGRQKPLGVGRDPADVERSFRRWLDAVGGEALINECVRLAQEKGVSPSNLAWWVGWLDTVSDAELRPTGGIQ